LLTYPAPPVTEPTFAGLILAAGQSSRMGRPKALLTLNDRTFLEGLIDLFRGAGVAPLLVVVAEPHRAEIVARLPPDVYFTVNDRPQDGQVSSLKAGLNALHGAGHAVLVGLIDQPTLAPETLTRLLDAWRQTRARAVVPRHQGERGHPVVLGRCGYPALLRARRGDTLREILEGFGPECVEIDMEDPRVLLNVNHPADYLRLLELYGLPHEKTLGDRWQNYVAEKSRSGRE
jgi:molybdenum cofactor cytidylyltransferase